jgi:hypothetical protein
MTPRLLLLMLCLTGNVVLATALVRHSSSPARAKNEPRKISAANRAPAEISSSIAPAANDIPDVSDFQWSQLTAPDLAVYIVRLRAFGTPEPKIREIIFGAVESIYRPQRGALRPPVKKPDDTKFWERRNHFYVSNSSTKEQRAQLRALHKEEADLLKSLLGDDVYEQMAKDSGNDWTEKYYAFIPKELREKVQDIDEQMNDDKQEIYAKNDGYMDQYAQEDLRKVEKKYHDELAKILTPDQLLEWDLRHSDTANQLKNGLSAFDPNEDEFRALFKYKQAQDDLNSQRNPDDDSTTPTADERKALAEKQKALDAELAETVGTNRVAEYKLEQDYSYRNLIDSGVPKASVFALDDMKKQAQDAANKIRKDNTLTPAQRSAALSAIRAETQNSINGLLNAKQVKQYSGQGGWWLNNIAPPQPPPATP